MFKIDNSNGLIFRAHILNDINRKRIFLKESKNILETLI